MAYNKAREEKKWRLWKEAEEKQLRSLGVSESDIEKLRVHDWAIFNSDRRYYQRMQETGTFLEEVATDMTHPEKKTVLWWAALSRPNKQSASLQARLRFGGIFMCWSNMTATLLIRSSGYI